MKYKYDLHVHSCLSPCAENDMTPATIVAFAKLSGLDFIAVSDHNAIDNVEVALKCGAAYGVCVVPAVEIQTEEDIHLLCLFKNLQNLKAFFSQISFHDLKNDSSIYGDQLVMDEDDNIVRVEDRLLLHGAKITPDKVKILADEFGGIAIPAHIDREGNSMLAILGAITDEFKVVELSTKAKNEEVEKWSKDYTVIIDSDAHTVENIGVSSEIELPDRSVFALIDYLKSRG